MRRYISAALGTLGCLLAAAAPATAADNIFFNMARSQSVENAGCALNVKGRVTINSLGPVEVMHVEATGLPPNQEFDLFVIQRPDAPFGLSWYQGDMESNAAGRAVGDFIGRFNVETFIVAPGAAAAPVVHNQAPFADAATNPATAPVHTFHIGLWFGSPDAAIAAGCPNTVTPFNGDHRAGIQVLSTRNFPATNGPLRRLEP
ncbi:MAG TPA: hypothetical protein VJQ52_16795 [Steroidobacteraceae bacterium]|nr:hypothetical protein [Steroidobacteraceae bacterium]